MSPTKTAKLQEATDHLVSMWSSETEDFQSLVLQILASLPGSEELEGLVEPRAIGWLEVRLLTDLLEAIENADDVRQVVARLLADDE